MKISTKEVKLTIKKNLHKLDEHLSTRVYCLLNDLLHEELLCNKKVDLFSLLVYLIHRADANPASSIANLLILLRPEEVCQLDVWTISDSAAFLRDHLKKEDIERTLRVQNS